MTTERVKVMKEFHKLLRTADKLYDSQVQFVLEYGEKIDTEEVNYEGDDSDRYLEVFFFVTPKDGLYKNARVKFKMRIDVTKYPNLAPVVTCRNRIYHPNISYLEEKQTEADICVSPLFSDWEPEVGLDGAVMAVLFLFHNPQLNDALSRVFGVDDCYDGFVINVKKSLRGESVNGNPFDRLIIGELDITADNEKNGYNVTKTTMTMTSDTVTMATNSNFTRTKKLNGAGVNTDGNIMMLEDVGKEDTSLPEETENKESKPIENNNANTPDEESAEIAPENERFFDDSKPLSSAEISNKTEESTTVQATETCQQRITLIPSATKFEECSTQSTVAGT